MLVLYKFLRSEQAKSITDAFRFFPCVSNSQNIRWRAKHAFRPVFEFVNDALLLVNVFFSRVLIVTSFSRCK